jgi:acyl-ACP thioesterase
MQTAPDTWKEKYTVKVYEADNLGRAGIVPLFDYFQDIAWCHYSRVEAALGQFLTKSQIWAMTRVEIHIERPALWKEEVELETWSRGIEKLTAYRDFFIRDTKGNQIGAGTSTWVVLDLETKKIQRLNDIAEKWPSQVEKSGINKNADKVLPPENPVYSGAFNVNYSDMDVNQHVNSGRYIQWIIDDFGREFLEKNTLGAIKVNFADEAMPGDEIVAGRQDKGGGLWRAHLIRKGSAKEVCRAEIQWK